MSQVAHQCTEDDIRECRSTSSPPKGVKRPFHTCVSQAKPGCNAPSVQIIPGDDFANAFVTAAMLNDRTPQKVFMLYANHNGPDIPQFDNMSVMEIRRQLTDSLWQKQSGAWCGLHALNFLRSPGTEIHTRKDVHDFQAQLQAENQTIGNLNALHKDMVLKDGWI